MQNKTTRGEIILSNFLNRNTTHKKNFNCNSRATPVYSLKKLQLEKRGANGNSIFFTLA